MGSIQPLLNKRQEDADAAQAAEAARVAAQFNKPYTPPAVSGSGTTRIWQEDAPVPGPSTDLLTSGAPEAEVSPDGTTRRRAGRPGAGAFFAGPSGAGIRI